MKMDVDFLSLRMSYFYSMSFIIPCFILYLHLFFTLNIMSDLVIYQNAPFCSRSETPEYPQHLLAKDALVFRYTSCLLLAQKSLIPSPCVFTLPSASAIFFSWYVWYILQHCICCFQFDPLMQEGGCNILVVWRHCFQITCSI